MRDLVLDYASTTSMANQQIRVDQVNNFGKWFVCRLPENGASVAPQPQARSRSSIRKDQGFSSLEGLAEGPCGFEPLLLCQSSGFAGGRGHGWTHCTELPETQR